MFPAYLPAPDEGRLAADMLDAPPEMYLESIADDLRREFGSELELVEGDEEATPSDGVSVQRPDLIVMTVDGVESLAEALASVEEDPLAPVPMLAIPPLAAAPHPSFEQAFQHVLIPLDGSVEAETVLTHAVDLGRLADARYTLLHVLPPWTLGGYSLPDEAIGPPWAAREEDEARASLRRLAALLTLQGLSVAEMVVRGAHPARAIVDVARDVSADLIALTTIGGRPRGRLLGDVAEKVLFGTTVPVLLCRPPQA